MLAACGLCCLCGWRFFCFLPFMSRCVVGVADSVRHGVTREFAIGAATVASPVSYDNALIEAGVNSSQSEKPVAILAIIV